MKEHTSKFSFYVVCFQNKKSWIFQILLWFIVFNLEKEKKKKLNFKSTLRLYGQLFVVKQLLFYHFLLIIFFLGGGCWLGGVGLGGGGWVEWGWGLRMKIYMIHKLVKNKNKNSEINNVQNKLQQVYSIWNH